MMRKGNKGAMGIIASSASGSVVQAWTRKGFRNSLTRVEAAALLLARSHAQSLGTRKAFSESVAQSLIAHPRNAIWNGVWLGLCRPNNGAARVLANGGHLLLFLTIFHTSTMQSSLIYRSNVGAESYQRSNLIFLLLPS